MPVVVAGTLVPGVHAGEKLERSCHTQTCPFHWVALNCARLAALRCVSCILLTDPTASYPNSVHIGHDLAAISAFRAWQVIGHVRLCARARAHVCVCVCVCVCACVCARERYEA